MKSKCVAAAWAGIVVMGLSSCGNGPPVRPDSLVVVRDVRIPEDEPWVARFARHTWVDYREDRQSAWKRLEIVNESSGLIHREISGEEFAAPTRWGETVVVLGQSDGRANPGFADDIREFAQRYDATVYRPYPGPNSNSIAENLLRSVDGVEAMLDHNAVGKEWGFYAGKTAGGTGLEWQTPVLGMALGIREGVEVSLMGLSAGISLAPPSLKIPILPPFPRW